MYIIPSKNSTRQNTQSHRATDTTHDTPQSPPESRGLDKASDQGDSRRRVVERISLSNKILKAEPICGTERYSVTLAFRFPLTFSRTEAQRLIDSSDPWRYPEMVTLQLLIEGICQGGAS